MFDECHFVAMHVNKLSSFMTVECHFVAMHVNKSVRSCLLSANLLPCMLTNLLVLFLVPLCCHVFLQFCSFMSVECHFVAMHVNKSVRSCLLSINLLPCMLTNLFVLFFSATLLPCMLTILFVHVC